MPTLKDIELKIKAVKKTGQITKAMNMVATSRLRGAQTAMDAFRPYAGKFGEVLGSLAQRAGGEANPLLIPKEEVRNVHIVLCTSDRGLCGGFNLNLIEKAEKLAAEKEAAGMAVTYTAFGKRAADWCKKEGVEMLDGHIGVVGSRFDFAVAATAGRKLIDGFLSDQFDEVYLIYANFVSLAKQLPTTQQLLPIPPLEGAEEDQTEQESQAFMAEHICEPSVEELLGELLPRSVCVQLYSGLLETSTSEHAARMMAMDNANKACKDMIENLTLTYNKARQSAITADLMDIVGGAEALKG